MGAFCSTLKLRLVRPGRQQRLQNVLRDAAELEPQRYLILYPQGDTSSPRRISYAELYAQAQLNSLLVRSLEGFQPGQSVLIHLDDHWDAILWFWSVLLADGLPVISTAFSNVEDHRRKYIQGLSTLLQSPICITTTDSLPYFEDAGPHSLRLHTIESLDEASEEIRKDSSNSDLDHVHIRTHIRTHTHTHTHTRTSATRKTRTGEDETALLMLTSGSTGNAKAVKLSHAQVLAAVAGKASVRKLPPGRPLLNWIRMDHVASLVEIHIQAVWLKVDQVHVYPSDVVSSPRHFLDLLSRHKVCRSFAPNFFLAKLVATLGSGDDIVDEADWDLSSLTILASGGEANDVKTCIAVSELLEKYGARHDVLTPGFGMTETCAGAIYNMNCPQYDVARDRTWASLGTCMKGIEMRVTVVEGEEDEGEGGRVRGTGRGKIRIRRAAVDEPGHLEVRGPIVFKGYYRNPQATAEAISVGGWFRTGDQAAIDSSGCLHLVGRFKEVVNINGVKREMADVQAALEEALAGRVARVICFPSRAGDTEQVTVTYLTTSSSPLPADQMVAIEAAITQACFLSTGSRPLVFSLGEESLPRLPLSSLGKVSRAKMRTLFEAGAFDADVELYNQMIQQGRRSKQNETTSSSSSSASPSTSTSTPRTDEQNALIHDIAIILDTDPDSIDLDSPIYSLGVTSIDLIRLKNRIDHRLNITLPVILLMKHPTVRSFAEILDTYQSPSPDVPAVVPYDPVVPFHNQGDKTPLWLIHPGVGEVLVFVGLAQHMKEDQRPIYALRARGFDRGQGPFVTIAETVETYLAAIRKRQPHGPYALAGYSYGTMIAFEMAKALEGDGETVGFLGSFNLPPHIKQRMRQLSWNMCLLHLAQFLGLVEERYAEAMEEEEEEGEEEDAETEAEAEGSTSAYRDLPREAALRQVLDASDSSRLEELALPPQGLERWADVAFGLQSMAVDYDPSGSVGVIDVFHAIPLKMAARCPEEWVREHLARWGDFCRTTPRFHHVQGAHYTMLGPDYVESFSVELKKALRERGL